MISTLTTTVSIDPEDKLQGTRPPKDNLVTIKVVIDLEEPSVKLDPDPISKEICSIGDVICIGINDTVSHFGSYVTLLPFINESREVDYIIIFDGGLRRSYSNDDLMKYYEVREKYEHIPQIMFLPNVAIGDIERIFSDEDIGLGLLKEGLPAEDIVNWIKFYE